MVSSQLLSVFLLYSLLFTKVKSKSKLFFLPLIYAILISMEIEVLKFDNLGRGIGYYNDKIIFIPKSVPGDILLVEKTVEKKNYLEGKIVKIIKPSKLRVKPLCPYFSLCGGCDLMHISLSNTLEYKLKKVTDIFKHNHINEKIENIIKSKDSYNYRNKVTLKIVDENIGFYECDSHKLVSINNCYLCNEEINKVIKDLPLLELKNGNITIRVNYKNEILLIIDSEDGVNNLEVFNKKYQLVGVIQNNKLIYGEDFLMDKIGDYLFKVSFDAFFQVNPFICANLFDLIKQNTKDCQKVLDLYCGVGTLSIVSSTNAKYVLGVEINENAIKNAEINKCFNNALNCEFICADTKNIIDKITEDYDTIILDPPRSGVIREVLDKIKNAKIKKIIYVSCNPITLARDLNILLDYYSINTVTLLDMFPNTEHVECFCVLNLN